MGHTGQAAAVARLETGRAAFATFLWRITACHALTYLIAGMIAYAVFDYKSLFETGPLAALMRPMDSPWIAAGPSLQIIRGLIFAVALYPFRKVFLEERNGWLKLWGLFVGLAILSTAGPSPGSVEGFIYTKLPLLSHLRGMPEVLAQTAALSAVLVAWYRTPRRAWNIGMGIAVGLVLLMGAAALLAPRPEAFK